jgi:hypothetical protein
MWIDGTHAGTCVTGEAIGMIEPPPPPHPNADGAGFEIEVEVRGLGAGPHALWATAPTSDVPVTTTYFEIGSSSGTTPPMNHGPSGRTS